LDAAPCVLVVARVRTVECSTWGPSGRGRIAREDNDDSLPVVVVAGSNACEVGAVLLVEKVVDNSHFGASTGGECVVDGERGAFVVDWHSWVPAITSYIGILALCSRWCQMC